MNITSNEFGLLYLRCILYYQIDLPFVSEMLFKNIQVVEQRETLAAFGEYIFE